MVDYTAMWMTRRIGRNTALSMPMWPLVVLGLLILGSIIGALGDLIPSGGTQQSIPVWALILVPVLVIAAPVAWVLFTLQVHQTHAQLMASCKHCMVRAGELQEIEARDAVRQARSAELARLNRKYRA